MIFSSPPSKKSTTNFHLYRARWPKFGVFFFFFFFFSFLFLEGRVPPLLGDDASFFSFEQSPNTLTKGHGGKNALFFSSFTRAKKVGGQGGRKYLRRAAPLLFFCALLRVCNKPYLFECPSRLLRKMKKGENRRRERESGVSKSPPPPFSLSLQREKNASADLQQRGRTARPCFFLPRGSSTTR